MIGHGEEIVVCRRTPRTGRVAHGVSLARFTRTRGSQRACLCVVATLMAWLGLAGLAVAQPPVREPHAFLRKDIGLAESDLTAVDRGQAVAKSLRTKASTAWMQTLAAEYRSRVLQGHVDRAPGAWQWLPLGGIVRASGRPSTSSMAM